MQPTTRAFLTGILTLVVALPAYADDQKTAALQSMADGLNASQQSMAQQRQSAASDLKKIIQQEAQDKDDAARRKQQQTATALAAMGAAIAGMGCIMGMKAAKEQTDPSMKAMMMSMAMQQCSQAAQSAANAAKNDSGQQKLADNSDDPTIAPMASVTVPTSDASDTPSPEVAASDTPTPNNQLADNNNGQSPGAFDPQATGTPSSLQTGATTVAGTGDGKSDLAPIPKDGTTYDESAKTGNSSVGDSNSGSSGGFGSSTLTGLASAGSAVGDVLNKLSEVVSGKAHGGAEGENEGAAGGGGPESSAAAGGPGAEGGGGEKDPAINSMLAGMMGPNGGPVVGGPREDVIAWRPAGGAASANGQKPPNIFQYAAYRMKKMSKEGGVTRGAKRVSRGLASTPLKAPAPTPAMAPLPPSAQNAPARPGNLVAVKP